MTQLPNAWAESPICMANPTANTSIPTTTSVRAQIRESRV
jgi:hypothetical protein